MSRIGARLWLTLDIEEVRLLVSKSKSKGLKLRCRDNGHRDSARLGMFIHSRGRGI